PMAHMKVADMQMTDMQMTEVQASATEERQDQKYQGKTADGQERAGNRTHPRGASCAGSGGQQVNRAIAQGRPGGQGRPSPDRPSYETAITHRVDSGGGGVTLNSRHAPLTVARSGSRGAATDEIRHARPGTLVQGRLL